MVGFTNPTILKTKFMKNFKFLMVAVLVTASSYAQEIEKDSSSTHSLKEVIVIGQKATLDKKQYKSLATVEEYLENSPKINMIKRGGYAWEPLINNMPSERTLITIDGMRIFAACTDKMDPITSYVEISNLSEASIVSGQQGAVHGSTIGGGIDLKRQRGTFKDSGWKGSAQAGFETNNKQKIGGLATQYSDSTFYFDAAFMARDAENYYAGDRKEVLYSQYGKYNVSGNLGFLLKRNSVLEASIIYDRATNVGYPALPMDVSLAEALIASATYKIMPTELWYSKWDTKIYFNKITHIMDDSKRPDVPIRMDMPGWSTTYGFYSTIERHQNKHHLTADINGFLNQSRAEMTMYPNDPNENAMFMLTWPDVQTRYVALQLKDHLVISDNSDLEISASLGAHTNEATDLFGLQSLQIIYPEMEGSHTRLLKSLAVNFNYSNSGLGYGLGLGYGERAASVSEGYGFYLFNSFDRYDYIGNPTLKNEQSLEFNFFSSFKTENTKVQLSGSYFNIRNYIVGISKPSFLPMTIGADGVKVYSALNYAVIASADITFEQKLTETFTFSAQATYSQGQDDDGGNLPFISPLQYKTALKYYRNQTSAEISFRGNAAQTAFNSFYGEDRTASYGVFDMALAKSFIYEKTNLTAKIGAENILDSHYSTYTDWNNIPRMGRNIFVSLKFSL